MGNLGKQLIILGGLLILIGLLLTLAPRCVNWLGRLPGDITIKRENFSFHFPIVTSLLLSALLSLILWFFRR